MSASFDLLQTFMICENICSSTNLNKKTVLPKDILKIIRIYCSREKWLDYHKAEIYNLLIETNDVKIRTFITSYTDLLLFNRTVLKKQSSLYIQINRSITYAKRSVIVYVRPPLYGVEDELGNIPLIGFKLFGENEYDEMKNLDSQIDQILHNDIFTAIRDDMWKQISYDRCYDDIHLYWLLQSSFTILPEQWDGIKETFHFTIQKLGHKTIEKVF
jgi:hypothetical protein